MRFLTISLTVLATAASYVSAVEHEEVSVKITNPVECDRKTQKGDQIEVHYRGTLAHDGTQFDASYDRGSPLSFTVGTGQVIKGWDEGLLGMCVGEKRLLTIKPEFGYGNQPMGPIPAGSTLIFETELMGIAGVPKDEL
ncbi:Peptidyl-prolyl cis-trans isomerase fpr2 [Acarospora aff. strigata]|nr:Peptidyl-prolyl cis-trans isomerase fpr2 [Acarospora aff. strigata]